MTQGDDSSKVPAIGTGTPRTRPADPTGSDTNPVGVSPLDRADLAASAAATQGVSEAVAPDIAATADAIGGVHETRAVDATTRLASVASLDAVSASEGDVAIAAALRSGALDAAGALERIVDEVIRSEFAGDDSPQLRATLLEAFSNDPLIAALLSPE